MWVAILARIVLKYYMHVCALFLSPYLTLLNGCILSVKSTVTLPANSIPSVLDYGY